MQTFAVFDPARMHAEDEWRTFVVAIRDNVLVGVVQVEGDQIVSLHVDPACWNDGVGCKLLDAAERQVARVHPIIRLEVRAFNARARAFYAHRGWREVRSYPGTECGSAVENVEMQKVVDH